MKLFRMRIKPSVLWVIHLLLVACFSINSYATTGGRFAIPELEGAITIDDEDGVAPGNLCSNMEWPSGAGEVLSVVVTPLSGAINGTGQLVIVHPNDRMADQEMYVYFSIDDNSPNVAVNIDRLVLMFDLSHDHATETANSFVDNDDRGIRFNRDGTVERVFGDITGPTVDDTPGAMVFPDVRECISERDDDNDGVADSTGWVMEAQLVPADLGLNNFNFLMGIAVLAVDQSPTPSLGAWPSTAGADPNTWANLITRAPIDFVLLLDQSGSMSTDDKWDSAKQAGNNFRSVLAQLHDTDLSTEYSGLGVTGGGDRLGLATFSSSLSGNADQNSALISIDATVSDYTGVLAESPGGGTPMADGVNQAFTMFGGAGNLDASALSDLNLVRQKVVLMLSDGKHNVPSSTMNFDSQGVDFDYLPATPNCDSAGAVDSLVRVNTVAIGRESSTDPLKLSGISDCFSGNQLTNIYNSIGATGPALTAELSRFYFETIYPYYHLNMITDIGDDFSLQAGERKLLLFAFWSDTTSVSSLSITQPDASVANGTCPAGLGYCYLLVDNPEPGEYTQYSAPGSVANGRYALLDLHVEARFAMDNQPHGTSSTITLKARLQEGGKPITGASVLVDVKRPEEGFGTFASTHSIDSCVVTRPTVPSVDIIGSVNDVRVSAVAAVDKRVVFSSSNLNLQATVQNGDTNPPVFTLMDRLMEACGKDDLETAQESGLQLFDDGSNGDATANDGIYTLVYENTEIEGNYIFRFTASGVTSANVPFQRLKEIGEYVRVDVDPASSLVASRDIQQNGTLIVREYTVTPRDMHGGYLGPGRVEDVRFAISGAQALGNVVDYNNGMYGQIVAFDSTQGEPDVTPVVQDKPINPDKPSSSSCPLPVWMLWLIVLLILIICLLLWLLLLCKSRHHAKHAGQHRAHT